MSLNFGRTLMSIPGPSVIPDRVLNAMHRPSPNIYEGELITLTESLTPDLQALAKTTGDVAIYIGNGHAAWEAALNNLFNAGDTVLVVSTGRFALGWGGVAESLGIQVEVLEFGMHAACDPIKLAERLKADKSHKIKGVLTVQTDTATSVQNDIAAMRGAIDAAGHEALFLVDCIASLGCEPHFMDDWGVDVMISASQKGVMTPAGLSFIWLNAKAAEARKGANPSYYWDWASRIQPEYFYHRFAGTAPTQHLFALREALNILMHEEGLENAWRRHDTFARAIWAAVDAWGSDGAISHNIVDRNDRSRAVSSLRTQPGAAGKIRNWCEHQGGVTLGIGLGLAQPGTPEWDRQFRIGHMGHTNPAMIMSTLGAIDTAMKACNIPHNSGGLEAASQVIAAHQAS